MFDLPLPADRFTMLGNCLPLTASIPFGIIGGGATYGFIRIKYGLCTGQVRVMYGYATDLTTPLTGDEQTFILLLPPFIPERISTLRGILSPILKV